VGGKERQASLLLTRRCRSIENEAQVSDECYTPEWIFNKLKLKFDIDVCAPEGGVSWVPAKTYFTKEMDALSQEWVGRVWMNPPYSKPKLFVEKFIAHGNGVALVPLSLSYWSREIWNASDAITLTERQPKFVRPDGSAQGIRFPTFLCAIGEENAQALHNFTDYRIR
jgi:hypothetical protein